MAKKQKSFFERLSELNDNFEEKNKKVTRKTKRNWINWGILGTLAVCLISGISIPLAINTTKINYIQPKKDAETAFTFNNLKNISIGDFSKLLKNDKTNYNEKFDDIYKKAIFYMYEKEYLASKQYQEIYNGSLNNNEGINLSLELKSLDVIKNEQKNKLEDQKNNLKSTFGFSTWENVFKERLLSEEYGKSSTEDQAIEYLTFKEIEGVALRSLEIEVKTVDVDFLERTAKKDIYEIDVNNSPKRDAKGQAKIMFKKGQKVFPHFVKDKNYFVLDNDPKKAIVIMTKSFIPELVSADKIIETYFNNHSVNIPTSILLPGVINSNLRFAFSFKDGDAKKKYINNFKYSVIKGQNNTIEIKRNIDILKSFNKPEDYAIFTDESKDKNKLKEFNDKRSVYEQYLNALTLTKGDTLGFLGVSTTSELINNNIDLAFGSFANELLKSADSTFKEINLDDLFKMPTGLNTNAESEIKKLVDEAKKVQMDSKITDINQKFNTASDKIQQVNEIIDKYFSELSEDQFNKVILENYNSHLIINANNKQYSSIVYKVKDKNDLLLIVTPTGLSLFSNKKVSTLGEFKKLITSDLKNMAKGNKTYFDLANKISDKNNKEQLVISLLEDQPFKNWLLTQKKDNKTVYTLSELDKTLSKIKTVKKGKQISSEISLYDRVEKYINSKVNTLNNINFSNLNGQVKINYLKNGSNNDFTITQSDKNAYDLVNAYLNKTLKKGEK
ncbi:HinT-interacting membrane complex protein P80 [Mycoplasmopsis cynos]|uniref:HinT-interacting membrane complex protein P80 n=1 Tax=Mycoplasmopsis cynos TaxID=171284 RepID=UPI0030D03B00